MASTVAHPSKGMSLRAFASGTTAVGLAAAGLWTTYLDLRAKGPSPGAAEVLARLIDGLGRTWIYLAIPVALWALSRLDQFRDLISREVYAERAVQFAQLLGALHIATAVFILRDLSRQASTEALHRQHVFWIALSGGIYLLTHHRNRRSWQLDPVPPITNRGLGAWFASGYFLAIGLTLFTLAEPLSHVLAFDLGALQSSLEYLRAVWGQCDEVVVSLAALAYLSIAFALADVARLRVAYRLMSGRNLIVVHGILLALLAGLALMRDLSQRTALPVPFLVAVSLVGLHLALNRGGRIYPVRQVEGESTAAPGPEFRDPQDCERVIFVAEGGGIHAAYRALTLMAELDKRTKGGFYRSLYATVGISGGSVGIAAYHTLRARFAPKTDEDFDALARAAHQVGGADFLLPIALRLAFTEPFTILLRTWTSLDRSKGLDEGLRIVIDAAMTDRPDTKQKPQPGQGPLRYYGTTSVRRGDRIVFGSHRLKGLKSNCDKRVSFRVDDITASSLSARFPFVQTAAMIPFVGDDDKAGPGEEFSVIDGGIYDNSGMDMVKQLLYVAKPAADRPFIVVACTSLDDATMNQYVKRDLPGFDRPLRPLPLQVPLSLVYAALGNLFGRNQDAMRDFLERDQPWIPQSSRAAPPRGPIFVPFQWDGKAVGAPLGWYLAGERAMAIRYTLGFDLDREFTRGNVVKNLQADRFQASSASDLRVRPKVTHQKGLEDLRRRNTIRAEWLARHL